jgi:DNA repair exonuclease SbcCD ATPase subunit
MQQLSLTQLDKMLDKSQKKIGDSWTTHGLNQGMKSLIKETGEMAEKISRQAQELSDMGEKLYLLFHTQHGFDKLRPHTLDMREFHLALQSLQAKADEFCADPVNVMTEKHFLVRKFFYTLVTEVRKEFEKAKHDAGSWLKNLLAPLKAQIGEHKAQLDKRTESLMKIHENQSSLQKNLEAIEGELAIAQSQSAALDQILLVLMKGAQKAPSAEAAPVKQEAETAGGPSLTLS